MRVTVVVAVVLLLAAGLIVLFGCEAMRSDAANEARRAERERKERLGGMRAATAEQPAGDGLLTKVTDAVTVGAPVPRQRKRDREHDPVFLPAGTSPGADPTLPASPA